MERVIGSHDLLVHDRNAQQAEEHVRSFFARNELVRYDRIRIDPDGIVNATDPDFPARLEMGLEGNRQAVADLVSELQSEGAADPGNWPTLRQGYASKLLHTVVHLLDGFFGAESRLYNLVEDSHQVSDSLRTRMRKEPKLYWLVQVTGTAADSTPDRVQALRPFGREIRKTSQK